MPWGSHLCSVYQNRNELQRLVTTYIQTGLEDHEGCVWILPPWLTPTSAMMALKGVIPRVYDYLSTAQLELIASADWYGWPGALYRVVTDGRDKIARMTARFSGLRVTGDISWAQSPDQRGELLEYERMVDETVQAAQVLALCTYPAVDWSLSDMFKNHQFVLLANNVGWSHVDLG